MKIDLGTIVTALHDSEINGAIAWFYDGVWKVALGDPDHGYDDEAVVSSQQSAV